MYTTTNIILNFLYHIDQDNKTLSNLHLSSKLVFLSIDTNKTRKLYM